jgi:hypothetical protein
MRPGFESRAAEVVRVDAARSAYLAAIQHNLTTAYNLNATNTRGVARCAHQSCFDWLRQTGEMLEAHLICISKASFGFHEYE